MSKQYQTFEKTFCDWVADNPKETAKIMVAYIISLEDADDVRALADKFRKYGADIPQEQK